jgi:hypothetical protein
LSFFFICFQDLLFIFGFQQFDEDVPQGNGDFLVFVLHGVILNHTLLLLPGMIDKTSTRQNMLQKTAM